MELQLRVARLAAGARELTAVAVGEASGDGVKARSSAQARLARPRGAADKERQVSCAETPQGKDAATGFHGGGHYTDPFKQDAQTAKQDEGEAAVSKGKLNCRQKKEKKTREYEVTRQRKPMESNIWGEKEILITTAYQRYEQRKDEWQAATAGRMMKQLTQPSINKNFGDFGVDPESARYTQIAQLNGGVKVEQYVQAA